MARFKERRTALRILQLRTLEYTTILYSSKPQLRHHEGWLVPYWACVESMIVHQRRLPTEDVPERTDAGIS